MRFRLVNLLTPIGLAVIVAMTSLSVIRGHNAPGLMDESSNYASQDPSPTPTPNQSPTPSPTPSPAPEMSPSPTPSPSPSTPTE
jgi:hypothetical protein